MKPYTRRQVLKTSGAAFVTVGIAGCSGSEDGDGGSGDGGSGDGGSGDGGSGDGGSEQEYPEWDPENPMESLPQLASTLINVEYAGVEGGFEFGSVQELQNMEPRDEPRHGDPPKERPDDESEWLDPDPILYAQSPDQEAAAYKDVIEPVLENIEKETGRSTEAFALDSDPALIEALRSERVHASAVGTGAVGFAVNLSGAVPFATQVTDNGLYGYRLWFVTRADNDIWSLDDLREMDDKTIPHTDPTSNSGHQAPQALIPNHDELHDGDIEFSGNHDSTQTGIMAGDYTAGPTWSGGVRALHEQGIINAEKMKVIWASKAFPLDPICYHHKLHPDLVDGIRRAFFDYDYAGTSWEEQFGTSQFVEFDYNTHYDINLKIQKANGVEYTEGALSE